MPAKDGDAIRRTDTVVLGDAMDALGESKRAKKMDEQAAKLREQGDKSGDIFTSLIDELTGLANTFAVSALAYPRFLCERPRFLPVLIMAGSRALALSMTGSVICAACPGGWPHWQVPRVCGSEVGC